MPVQDHIHIYCFRIGFSRGFQSTLYVEPQYLKHVTHPTLGFARISPRAVAFWGGGQDPVGSGTEISGTHAISVRSLLEVQPVQLQLFW